MIKYMTLWGLLDHKQNQKICIIVLKCHSNIYKNYHKLYRCVGTTNYKTKELSSIVLRVFVTITNGKGLHKTASIQITLSHQQTHFDAIAADDF